jgi:uncharacterized membrane protein YqiK
MRNEVIGSIVLWLIVLAVLVVIAVYLLRWLYRRSTKETAFVRTGFGGEKVVINSGAFVIPVLHEMTPVNMNVMRIEVRRGETNALITRDRMRVDLIAEFFLRVQPTRRQWPSLPKPSAAAPCSRSSSATCSKASSPRRSGRWPPN